MHVDCWFASIIGGDFETTIFGELGMDETSEEQTLEGWITSHVACQILECSYWHFHRKVAPHLNGVQPSGRYGIRFFRKQDVLDYSRRVA